MKRLWRIFLIALDFLRYGLATCLLHGFGLIFITAAAAFALATVAPDVVQIIKQVAPTPPR